MTGDFIGQYKILFIDGVAQSVKLTPKNMTEVVIGQFKIVFIDGIAQSV